MRHDANASWHAITWAITAFCGRSYRSIVVSPQTVVRLPPAPSFKTSKDATATHAAEAAQSRSIPCNAELQPCFLAGFGSLPTPPKFRSLPHPHLSDPRNSGRWLAFQSVISTSSLERASRARFSGVCRGNDLCGQLRPFLGVLDSSSSFSRQVALSFLISTGHLVGSLQVESCCESWL